MKKLMCIVCMVIIVILLLYIYYPVKIAISESELKRIDDEYIICRTIKTTGFKWEVCESSNGYKGCVFIEGNIINPNKLKFEEVRYKDNKYIMVGKFVGSRRFGEIEYPVFQAERWEILYPVMRGGLLPNIITPKYGITIMDFYLE